MVQHRCRKCPRVQRQASDGKFVLMHEGDETPARKDTPESHKDSGWQCNSCYKEWAKKGRPVKVRAGGQVPVAACDGGYGSP
jgi:hypothetical protein